MSFFLLSTFYPWLITFAFIGLFFILILMIQKIARELFKIPGKFALILFLSILIGFILRFNSSPNFHRIYSDEDRYLSYAVSFAKFNKAVSIDIATPEKIIMGIPDDAARTTVPVINGWILKIFGYTEYNLFQFAKIFSVLQIILIFILAYLLYRNYFIASLSSLGMALIPTNIYWSPSINLDTYAVTFALLTFIGAAWYARAPNIRSGALTLISFFLLLGVRIESFIFFPVIIFGIYAIRKDIKKPIFSKSELPYVILIFSIILFRIILSISVIGQKWCCAEALPLEAFAINYFIRNLLPNLTNLIIRPEFPFIISIFALITLISNKSKTKLAIGIWILIYFLIYSTYYAGNFFYADFSGSYGRYFLMLIPGLLILASMSIDNFIEKYKHNKKKIFFLLVIFAFCLFPTILKYKILISSSPYFNIVEVGPKILHEFTEYGILENTPKDSVIIHTLTADILMTNRTSVFIGYFFEKDEAISFVEKSLKEGKKVYLFQSYQCDIFPDRCVKIAKKFKFTPLNMAYGRNAGLDLLKVELK